MLAPAHRLLPLPPAVGRPHSPTMLSSNPLPIPYCLAHLGSCLWKTRRREAEGRRRQLPVRARAREAGPPARVRRSDSVGACRAGALAVTQE
eukprot:6180399-Pleurochrysis_carterae.AAC.4